jgi:hypothetical protein
MTHYFDIYMHVPTLEVGLEVHAWCKDLVEQGKALTPYGKFPLSDTNSDCGFNDHYLRFAFTSDTDAMLFKLTFSEFVKASGAGQ